MKKYLVILMAAIMLLGSSTAIAAESDPTASLEQSIQVYKDGERIFFNELPLIEDGTTLVQFRPIFEKLGLRIEWDGTSQTITGTKGTFKITLQIDNPIAKINGEDKALALAPRLVSGYTFVPLRFVGEATESKVTWNDDTRIIDIASTSLSLMQDILYSEVSELRYEGNLKDSKREGYGKLYYQGTLWYEGQFAQNKLEGQGKVYDSTGKNVVYEGQFKNNKMSGQGIQYDNSGRKLYEGLWENGIKNGYGKVFTKLGLVLYDGKFKNDLYDGEGTLYDASTGKVIYQGTYKEGIEEGMGKIFDSSGYLRYAGEFHEGKKHGKGKSYTANGLINYEGDYKNDVRDGIGSMYFPGGNKYVGGFKLGKFEGYGSYYYQNGAIGFQGDFKEGYHILYNRPIRTIVTDKGISTTTDYSAGYSYRINNNLPDVRNKLLISYVEQKLIFNFMPDGMNFATGQPNSPYHTLVSVDILTNEEYEKSPSIYTKLAETKDTVYVYTIAPNPYGSEGTSKPLYDAFNTLLKEAEQTAKNIQIFDMNKDF